MDEGPPTSACWRAGASLTPSPVTATVRCVERAARTSRSFCSGVARATICRLARDARSVSSSIASSSGPVRTRSPVSPAARAIADAVVGWSPVTTSVWIPASVAVRSASGMPARSVSENDRIARGRQASSSNRLARRRSRRPALAEASMIVCQLADASGSRLRARTASGAPRAYSSITSPRRARVIEYGCPSRGGRASRRSAGWIEGRAVVGTGSCPKGTREGAHADPLPGAPRILLGP